MSFSIRGTKKARNLEDNWVALKVRVSEEEQWQIRQAIQATEVHCTRHPESRTTDVFVDTRSSSVDTNFCLEPGSLGEVCFLPP